MSESWTWIISYQSLSISQCVSNSEISMFSDDEFCNRTSCHTYLKFCSNFLCHIIKNWLVPWHPFPLISCNLISNLSDRRICRLTDPDRAAVENRILTRMQGSTFAPSIVACALRNLAS